jgi:DNA-binding transcriptional LysR family regulator
MDVRRLRLLLELSRLGSMHEVAAELGTTTSSVSQGIAALARDVGTPLVEPDGRRVRLTPAGARLAEHAVTILAAVDAARLDLDPTAEPAGVLRVAGFATAIRRSLLPAMDDLARTHPGVEVRIHEHEPIEAFDLLARDDIDLALTYDYDLAPASWRSDHDVSPLWEIEWGLGVPARERRVPFASYADRDWIVNSRNTADEEVLRMLASMAGFAPRVVHRIDALELVDDLIVDGRGIGLLPRGRASRRGIRVLPLTDPRVTLRAYAVTRRGRDRWPPLRALVDQLTYRAGGAGAHSS